jgi:hypothetical protein
LHREECKYESVLRKFTFLYFLEAVLLHRNECFGHFSSRRMRLVLNSYDHRGCPEFVTLVYKSLLIMLLGTQ